MNFQLSKRVQTNPKDLVYLSSTGGHKFLQNSQNGVIERRMSMDRGVGLKKRYRPDTATLPGKELLLDYQQKPQSISQLNTAGAKKSPGSTNNLEMSPRFYRKEVVESGPNDFRSTQIRSLNT
jgi:hypothetical protein